MIPTNRLRPGPAQAAAALIFLLTLSVATASADSRLRFRRDLPRSDAGTDGILIVPLDAQVYAETRDGLPDVRILDDRGAEVPFAVERAVHRRTSTAREPVPARVDALRVIEGEALEITAVLEADAPEPDGATVHTPLADFERRVRVFGSRDGNAWEALVDDGRIFDYSRFMDVRNVDVPIPSRGFRRFKFVVEREADEQRSPFYELSRSRIEGDRERRTEVETILRRPFRIDRIALWRKVERPTEQEPVTTEIGLKVVKIDVDRGAGETRIDVDAGRLPLTRLSLRTSSRNFNRLARVLADVGEGRTERWVEIGRGRLSRYQLDSFRQERLALSFPEHRADRLRIVVDDGDNPPLDVTGVDGDAAEIRLVFLGARDQNYRLAYGSDDLDAPRYDAETVLAALGPDHRREVVAMDSQTPNPDFTPSPPRPGRSDGMAWLTLALVLMTIVLVWALVQAVRRADKLPMDDFED